MTRAPYRVRTYFLDSASTLFLNYSAMLPIKVLFFTYPAVSPWYPMIHAIIYPVTSIFETP
jgi:hypothetical protein